MNRRPDFVIIGAQKSASTLLLAAVRDHPEVWMPADEVPYFRDPLYDPAQMGAFLAPYAGHDERRLGLKCPDYLARPEVPSRLHAELDEPDLVACLRDPVARAVSAYFWFMRFGMIPVLDVEVGMRRILDGGLRDECPFVGEVLEWGLYHRQLEGYLRLFPREKLLLLTDDDLRRDPRGTVDQVYGFLGLSAHVPAPVDRSGRNEGVYALPRLRFLQRRARDVTVWSSDRSYANIPKPRQPHKRVRSLAIAGWDHVVLSRLHGNPRPVLSHELESELRAYFHEDVVALEALLGRSLGWGARGSGAVGAPPRAPDLVDEV